MRGRWWVIEKQFIAFPQFQSKDQLIGYRNDFSTAAKCTFGRKFQQSKISKWFRVFFFIVIRFVYWLWISGLKNNQKMYFFFSLLLLHWVSMWLHATPIKINVQIKPNTKFQLSQCFQIVPVAYSYSQFTMNSFKCDVVLKHKHTIPPSFWVKESEKERTNKKIYETENT